MFPHTVGAFSLNLENLAAVAEAIVAGDVVNARRSIECVIGKTTHFVESQPISKA